MARITPLGDTLTRPPVARDVAPALALVVVSTVDLRQLLREEVAALLRKQPSDGGWMTADEVAQLLGYRRQYIAELVRRHGLPSHQPSGRGGRHMFRRAEVETWVVERGRTR